MVVDRAAGVAAANLFTAVEPADAALHRVGERGGLFKSDDCAVEWVGRVANCPPLYKGIQRDTHFVLSIFWLNKVSVPLFPRKSALHRFTSR